MAQTNNNYRKHIDIYTDGSCFSNPGVGGWAAILIQDAEVKEISGGKDATTNNEMEIIAVLEALKLVSSPANITIYSDSKYVCNTINCHWAKAWRAKGWKKSDGKPAQHAELWSQILELLDPHNVKFIWVKGHAGNKYNERCDFLAVTESQKRKEFLKKATPVTSDKIYAIYYSKDYNVDDLHELSEQLKSVLPKDAKGIFLPKDLQLEELELDELVALRDAINKLLDNCN